MISKDTFKEALAFIKEEERCMCELEDVFNKHDKVFAEGRVPVSNWGGLIVKILEEAMGLPVSKEYGSTLSWWLWEMDYGKDFKVGDIELSGEEDCPFGKTPDLKDEDTLYEFLVWEGSLKKI